jgi:hypothetical protein
MSISPEVADSGWQQRTIMLAGDRGQTERVCARWAEAGWKVLTIDAGEPTPSGQPTHVVRVAVPPPGWLSDEDLLRELDQQD